ncbi:hypothetical protein [Streptomyces sp. DH12]|uniref:hypothetical protein n=1 Tax=Streptomyces sp. DH12 TaxID=2857010 RepID=UPI001E34165A|nr:hypothetical protein [Streptomyces sp. DH12]
MLADVIQRDWGPRLGDMHTATPAVGSHRPAMMVGQDGSSWLHLRGLPLRLTGAPRWATLPRERGHACVCVTTRTAPPVAPLLARHGVVAGRAGDGPPGGRHAGPAVRADHPDHDLSPAAGRTGAPLTDPQEFRTEARRAARVPGELRVSMGDAHAAIHPGTGAYSGLAAARMPRGLTCVGPQSGTCYSCGLADDDDHAC